MGGAVLISAAMAVSSLAQAAERTLSFGVSGVVSSVTAKSGQTVNAGAVLAKLDGRTFAAKVASCKAAVSAAEVELTFAADAEVRARQLFDDLSASAEEVERAQIRHVNAKAALARAKMKLTKALVDQERATLRAPSAGTVVAVPGFKGLVIDSRTGLQPVVVLSGN